MKKIFTMFIAVLIIVSLFLAKQAIAQAPQKMSYQAVIRNNDNALITSTEVGMRISILQGTATGTAVYAETQTPKTNANGLASLEIGSGTPISGEFSAINWAGGPYFIKTETDPTGGTNYTIVGTSELLSVPYALFSANGTTGADNPWTVIGTDIYNNNPGNVNIGLNTQTPTEKLTIQTNNNSYGISQRTSEGNMLATYIGGTSAGIGTFSNTNMRLYSNGVSAVFIASGSNNVGIGVDFPANKLQIGSMGATGFATNDFAIGNGTNAVAIYQTDASTLIGSTTDIILKPRNNGQGRVGINTDTPRASLDVDNNVVIQDGYYAYMNGTADLDGIGLCKFCDPQISIIASYGVYAAEFDAFSDGRIKNIISLSNTKNDLETINALQITDYTMKDKVQYGNKPFKKIIAQDVEKVFPQVVSKHIDFIPNVYQFTSKVEKSANGYLLSFANKHNISHTAKKLQVLLAEGQGMQQVEIISIPAENQVLINVPNLKPDKIFVYGEEVDDFRTVDYEGLTTLNISATQELSKLVKQQQIIIDNLQRQIELQEKRIISLEKKP